MNSLLRDLKYLQELDDRISGDKKALEEGAGRLAAAASRFKAFEDKLSALKADREHLSARHRELEAQIADLSVKKKNNEARQLSVKNDNEYNALFKEAEYLDNSLNQAEDEALEILDRLEKNELEISGQIGLVDEEAEIYARVSADTEKAMETGRGRICQLTEERQAIASALPALQARQYEDLLKRKGGRAVTASAAGMCLACRLSFPPQIFNELQRNEKIINCPNCGRIIYWQDHPDFKSDPPADGQK